MPDDAREEIPQHRDGPLVAPPNLRDPALYFNREVSWLAFNSRVLHEALDLRTPLLERVKFLAIVAANLDEFFQVRVSRVREQVRTGSAATGADGMTPAEQLDGIRAAVVRMLAAQSECLRAELLPALAGKGIRLHDRFSELDAADQAALAARFASEILPGVVTYRIDPAHPFPQVRSLSLMLAVALAGRVGTVELAVVTLPPGAERWVPLEAAHQWLSIEHLVGAHLAALFPGDEVLGWHVFRITRNTGLPIESADAAALDPDERLEQVEEGVQDRRFGEIVRVEVHVSMPADLRALLLRELNLANDGEGLPLTSDDLFEVFGPLDLTALMQIAAVDIPALHDPPFEAVMPGALRDRDDLFAVLREGDVLLHHPYHPFHDTVERLLAVAADDPAVRRVRITLYRTGRSLAELLLRAAERGKEVTALIELQARFDEENNISWAKRFEDAGVHVAYGAAGRKTHAKVMLIERDESGDVQRYVHLGTGNYNARTARLYTDFGLLSADQRLGDDVAAFFDAQLEGGSVPEYRRITVAPEALKSRLIEMIRREAAEARLGRPARVLAKMNALVDPEVIESLYDASRAGVEIDLIVRGICCLRPGVPGVSERIRVVSVLGRFLEHSRACLFHNAGTEECYIGSADWMPRNLAGRVEAMVQVRDPGHAAAIRGWLEAMLRDNRQAWDLDRDGGYTQRRPAVGEAERACQWSVTVT